jgi:WD40 repeat protein
MASDIIDFQAERGRHESLLGRADVMTELNALLLGGASRGWVLVKGGPGMGKSALLAEWLTQRERAGLPVPPHHFLRRGVEDWDRPEVVKRNLVAQVEKLYPELADSTARPESRLRELLQRVSDQRLKPRNERLVLVVDGLDEVEGESDGSNPLTRFLPHVLPSGVKFLCASKPTYPNLSWLEAREGVRTIDLDGERWAGSNKNVVRQYWEHVAPRFLPPLAPAFVKEAVQRAEGNVLYAVKLAEWLQEQPVEKRWTELLPRGLEALLDENWVRIQQLPGELRKLVIEGLGVVAVAREALPLSLLAAVAQWKDWEDGERFLRVARSFLLEESGHERGEKAWRPFHESFRSFILSKLGRERVREVHRRLAEYLCRPPGESSDRGFRWSYALRHGVTHWLTIDRWEQALGLFTHLGYLAEKCRVAGVLSLEDALLEATVAGPEDEREIPRALLRAVQAESHHLRTEPGSLPLLVYNRLRSSGWAKTRIEKTLCFPDGLPALRLRHPVKTGGNARTLEGHEAGVNGCVVTPDGRHVVSASDDGSLKVWELETGRVVATLEGHGAGVNGCVVTPDGRHVVSVSWNKTKVWELETGREVAELEGHEAFVQGCAVTPDGRRVVSASEDGTLTVWAWETGREVVTLKGHKASVTGCAVTPDGRHVVSASGDRTLKVWELETGREVASLKGHDASVNGCAVMPDGRHVVSVSWKKTKVWEWETGREVAELEWLGTSVNGCAATPDGRHVLLASEDGLLKVWEWKTGRVVAELKGHGERVNGCAVTPDGQRVVSASGDRTLKVWEWETGQEAAELEGHGGWVTGCAVTPDRRHVVSASSDGTLKVWELETGREVASLKGDGVGVNGCAVTPDGRHVVAAFSEPETAVGGMLKVWEWETGRVVAELKGHKGSVTGCAVTPDGRHVVSSSGDGTLKVWEWETGRVVAMLEGHRDWVTGCAVTPDGWHVVSASWDKTLRVWEWETGRVVATLEGHGDWVNGCAVTPDGRHLVSASQDRTLKVWEWKTGRVVATLEGHGASVDGCVVTQDGRHVVSASQDRTLKVWALKTERCLHTLHGVDAFLSVSSTPHVICAGDALGNVWIVEMESEVPRTSPAATNTPSPGPTMSVSFPKPVLEAYRSHSLALFIGSGLSLGRDVKGNLPTWSQLPLRLLDACERLGSLDAQVIQDWRNLFKRRMSLELMLAQLGSLRAVLGYDYPKALDAIFRPSDAAPGSAHQSVARLGVRAILTTNYDPLIEEVGETPRRQVYTWKDSDKALRDLESGRNVLLKVHGTAEHHETVVMTELEYHKARSDVSYQKILSHLLQGYTFLFIGYGMNDPLDLDLVLKWNAEAFKSATRRHYALLKDPSDNDRDRYEREYKVRVIPYSDHSQLPAILEEFQRVAAS